MNATRRLLCILHLSTILLASCSSGINDFAPNLPAGSRATLKKEGVMNPMQGQLGLGVDKYTANKINVNWRNESTIILSNTWKTQPKTVLLSTATRSLFGKCT